LRRITRVRCQNQACLTARRQQVRIFCAALPRLHVDDDALRGTEVEQFPGLGNAADRRARKRLASADQEATAERRIVSRTKSNVPVARFIASVSDDSSTWCAPSTFASSALAAQCVSTLTSAPMALASFTPMCPRSPRPATAAFEPGPTGQCLSGEQLVMPAQSSGAARAGSPAE